jgi:ADP-heptose:LPS heptosyltransferase
MPVFVQPNPPEVRQGRFARRFTRLMLPRLGLLSTMRGTLTVWDSFGTPGDTISASTLCRHIRARHPRLKINCITPNPELLKLDPSIDTLNGPVSAALLRFWYLDLIEKKDGTTNLLAPSLEKVGIRDFEYRARFYLSAEEIETSRLRVAHLKRPIVTVNVQSREQMKVWRLDRWAEVVAELSKHCDLIQLGAKDEPEYPGTLRLAGQLNMRESVAVLSQSKLHLGGVSFLMHAANGLDVPSVIVYGGRETPANSGYRQNENLYVALPCSPCWLHDSHGHHCPHNMECMKRISAAEVLAAARRQLPIPE